MISGQGTVYREGDLVIKSFRGIKDYEQEKWALATLSSKGIDFIPKVVSFNDQLSQITTQYGGERLDATDWRANKLEWTQKVVQLMDHVWSLKMEVPGMYVKTGNSAFEFVREHFLTGYPEQMLRIGVSQELIDKSLTWMNQVITTASANNKGKQCLIHFDLSPRNILIDKQKICIIDWSRAIWSELLLEIAIIREKFELIGSGKDLLMDSVSKDLDLELVDDVAHCFTIYRKAKKVNISISLEDYVGVVNQIIAA